MNNFKLFFESLSSELKDKVINSDFLKEIRYMGGRIHFVGGFVRDSHLGIESKDIDLIVSNIPHDQLFDMLEKHGKVSKVGESFGVLKFVPNEFAVSEPIDIAVPRTERPMNQQEKEAYKSKYGKFPSSYQAFAVEPDHLLKVEDDLIRRDFTINAIAQDLMGNFVDPYGGAQDIQNKLIKMVSPRSFSDDPLRMLRGVQFASRFGFEIEPKTFEAIKRNAELIKGIPGERILLEIEKIVKKGDQLLGAKLLCETNLWQEISKLSCKDHDKDHKLFQLSQNSKNISEFLFLMMFGTKSQPIIYKHGHDGKDVEEHQAINVCRRLKCDLITEKQVKGLFFAWNQSISLENNSHTIVFYLNRIHPTCLSLNVLPERIKSSIESDMPKSFADVRISGDDVMKLGYKGQEVGNVLKHIINKIFNNSLVNSREEITTYLSNDYPESN